MQLEIHAYTLSLRDQIEEKQHELDSLWEGSLRDTYNLRLDDITLQSTAITPDSPFDRYKTLRKEIKELKLELADAFLSNCREQDLEYHA
jgi:hypothetical protein